MSGGDEWRHTCVSPWCSPSVLRWRKRPSLGMKKEVPSFIFGCSVSRHPDNLQPRVWFVFVFVFVFPFKQAICSSVLHPYSAWLGRPVWTTWMIPLALWLSAGVCWWGALIGNPRREGERLSIYCPCWWLSVLGHCGLITFFGWATTPFKVSLSMRFCVWVLVTASFLLPLGPQVRINPVFCLLCLWCFDILGPWGSEERKGLPFLEFANSYHKRLSWGMPLINKPTNAQSLPPAPSFIKLR